MGFFTRRSKKPEKELPIVTLDGPKTYAVKVVGTSKYQDTLENICGGRGKAGHSQIIDDVLLIHVDDNPHDDQAILVAIGGNPIGYLSRDDARQYRESLKQAGFPGSGAACSGMIVGGWDDGQGDKGHFGFRLDLPTGEEQ